MLTGVDEPGCNAVPRAERTHDGGYLHEIGTGSDDAIDLTSGDRRHKSGFLLGIMEARSSVAGAAGSVNEAGRVAFELTGRASD